MPAVYLEARNIIKTFTSGVFRKRHNKVLDGISLKIIAGKTVGIVGDSGIGKTTLGKIITGIENPTAGEIVYRGREIHSLGRQGYNQFRRKVQMMFQDSEGTLNPLKFSGLVY